MSNNNQNNQNPNRRWIAKVKNQSGQYGTFQKMLVDNPYPQTKEGQPNQYHKGVLLWLDAETGKHYHVKQAGISKVSEAQAQKGFSASLYIDLDDEYQVTELNNN